MFTLYDCFENFIKRMKRLRVMFSHYSQPPWVQASIKHILYQHTHIRIHHIRWINNKKLLLLVLLNNILSLSLSSLVMMTNTMMISNGDGSSTHATHGSSVVFRFHIIPCISFLLHLISFSFLFHYVSYDYFSSHFLRQFK